MDLHTKDRMNSIEWTVCAKHQNVLLRAFSVLNPRSGRKLGEVWLTVPVEAQVACEMGIVLRTFPKNQQSLSCSDQNAAALPANRRSRSNEYHVQSETTCQVTDFSSPRSVLIAFNLEDSSLLMSHASQLLRLMCQYNQCGLAYPNKIHRVCWF